MAKLTKKQKAPAAPVDLEKHYGVEEALGLVKANATAKFDETVEVALNLGVDPRHADQMVRGVVNLPKGSGKTVKIAVFAKGAKAEEATAAGADKVGVNTAGIARPELLHEISRRFGSQVLVLSVDARRAEGTPSGFEVTTHGGRRGTGIDAVEWAARGEELGVGEVLLNSMDADGTRRGYDLEMLRAVRAQVRVPVIASGGAGALDDFDPAVDRGGRPDPRERPIEAIADDVEERAIDTLADEVIDHRLGAAAREVEVVVASADRVGVALDGEAHPLEQRRAQRGGERLRLALAGFGQLGRNRMTRAGERHFAELDHVAIGVERQLGDIADDRLELLVAGNEVGFRVHFDDGSLGA